MNVYDKMAQEEMKRKQDRLQWMDLLSLAIALGHNEHQKELDQLREERDNERRTKIHQRG